MIALSLGAAEIATIAAIKARAAADPEPYAVVLAVAKAARQGQSVALLRQRNRDKSAVVGGLNVTFSHEEQRPGLVCRHLSVSLGEAMPPPGLLPHPAAVAALMHEFGFLCDLGQLSLWRENLGDERIAINVLEPLDGDMAHLAAPPSDPAGEALSTIISGNGQAPS